MNVLSRLQSVFITFRLHPRIDRGVGVSLSPCSRSQYVLEQTTIRAYVQIYRIMIYVIAMPMCANA